MSKLAAFRRGRSLGAKISGENGRPPANIVIPLVKCKSGDMSDLNDYRAIAISTSFSKLFESVIASHFVSNDSTDMYQF